MKHQQRTHQTTPDVASKKKPVGARAKGNGERKVQDEMKAVVASDNRRDDIIRQTAYSFYEARSYVGGYDLDDWLQAEALVDQTTAKDRGAQNAPS